MDPILLASFAAAKGAISACKAAIETANDIGEISGHIDKIFSSAKDVKHQSQASERSHNEDVVAKRIGESDEDEASLSAVAQRYVHEQEHQEALRSLAKSLDKRFGEGTWSNIIAEQKKAVKAQAERRKAAKQAQEERVEFWKKVGTECLKGGFVILIAGGIGSFLYWAATSGPAVR